MSVAENLAKYQAKRGVTNYRIAKEIGVNQTSITNWKEKGVMPHPRHVTALAAYFGVTEADMRK